MSAPALTFRLVRSLDELKSAHEFLRGKAVGVTVGNFDGVHLGHQALIAELVRRLESCRRPAEQVLPVLFTFYPHPRTFLSRGLVPEIKRPPETLPLTRLTERYRICSDMGIALVFANRFHRELSLLEPEDFVERFLVKALEVRTVVVGHDWSFGRGRTGTADTLAQLGRQKGFEVVVVPPVTFAGERVSSGAIKRLLLAGNVERAAAMLGRPYRLTGRVVRGAQRGRTLGFPTANLNLAGRLAPADGVYASWVWIEGLRYPAATNVGLNPTFGGVQRCVESHLLVPTGELYGRRICVEFVRRTREEQKFAGKEELIEAIARDVAEIRRILHVEDA